jgi:2-C-methyl-D-erythritol 4-phosphate cytidylyltransferase
MRRHPGRRGNSSPEHSDAESRGDDRSIMSRFAVIIPAAGSSNRFGSNKLAAGLGGRTVLQRSLTAFLRRTDVAHVVIATSDFAAAHDALTRAPFSPALLANERLNFCPGGASRAHSVANALGVVPKEIDWVAVHDAARPLVSAELIDRTLAAAYEHGAAAPAMAVSYTIKRATGPLPAVVRETVPRQDLWAMQTPQIMRREDLAAAIARCPIPLDQVTDDAQLLELIGKPVWLVPGDETNLKITLPMDLMLAEMLLAERSSEECSPGEIEGTAPVAEGEADVT